MISDEESISILQNDDQITIKKEKNNANESISAYSRSNLYNNSYSQKDLTVSQYYSIDESYNDSIVESKEDDTKVKQLSPIKRNKESHQSVISIPPLLQEEVIQESTPISENKSEACETEEPVETNERKTNHIVFDDEKQYYKENDQVLRINTSQPIYIPYENTNSCQQEKKKKKTRRGKRGKKKVMDIQTESEIVPNNAPLAIQTETEIVSNSTPQTIQTESEIVSNNVPQTIQTESELSPNNTPSTTQDTNQFTSLDQFKESITMKPSTPTIPETERKRQITDELENLPYEYDKKKSTYRLKRKPYQCFTSDGPSTESPQASSVPSSYSPINKYTVHKEDQIYYTRSQLDYKTFTPFITEPIHGIVKDVTEQGIQVLNDDQELVDIEYMELIHVYVKKD